MRWTCLFAALPLFAATLAPAPAQAELMISQLIVELQPGRQTRDDVEVWNRSGERAYVAVEPRQILDASLPTEAARRDPDPEKLGLLVSPSRMLLEPGQRKLVRIADLAPAGGRERVYRVTVKPVVGGLQSEQSGLKLLLGYDLLVLVRPERPVPLITGVRNGRKLQLENNGNVSVELLDGRQCAGSDCKPLPGKRVYAGGRWTVDLLSDLPADYLVKSPGRSERMIF